MSDTQVERILTDMIACNQFRMFGKHEAKGSPLWNPIAEAMSERETMFALGVDVRSVIRFVLEHTSREPAAHEDKSPTPLDLASALGKAP